MLFRSPLPFSPDPEGLTPHVTDMEILLHCTQCSLDDLREDHIIVTVEHHDLVGDLDSLRVEHDTVKERDRDLTSQLRTTCLARDHLAKKMDGV